MGAIGDILKRAASQEHRAEDYNRGKIQKAFEYYNQFDYSIISIYYYASLDGNLKLCSKHTFKNNLMESLEEIAYDPSFFGFEVNSTETVLKKWKQKLNQSIEDLDELKGEVDRFKNYINSTSHCKHRK